MDDVDIETARLLLRRWRAADLEPFAAMNADQRVMRYLPAPMTRAESRAATARFDDHFARHGFGPWAVERRRKGDFIGFVGLQQVEFAAPFAPAVEIGWRLAPHAWGRGYATEAAREALDAAFDRFGLDEVVSLTVPENLPSLRVMERIGMTRDVEADFDHPLLPEGHELRRHVLHRISRPRTGA